MSAIGSSPIEGRKECGKLPEKTTFTNSTGEVAKYFFKNNPWKLSEANDFQKIYRFCIICGDERFSSEEWSKVIDLYGPPTICKKRSCWDGLALLPGFVPSKHYLIKTELDKNRVGIAKKQEFFEEIDRVTTSIRNDKVYVSEDEMPFEYVETFKRLENFPVETRIFEIDLTYFEYQEKHDIKVGKYMTDTSDPFLKALAVYRQKSYEILDSFRYS